MIVLFNILIFFLLDLLLFFLFKNWVFSFLLIYFLLFIFTKKQENIGLNYLFILLFLIQDYLNYGIVGPCLFYVVPIIFAQEKLKSMFSTESKIFFIPFLAIILIFKAFFVEFLVLQKNMPILSTFFIIFTNIIVGSLILLGTRGNRS
ncbi:MAG: hypothetical protein SZ59_C0002G0067 [candidate division TM6 bacterium GW2011_GWF2_28_16]|nr:MAG: hypothetical protein SZ59_C0002G0067 [candidate division TM6 bacterium GW2011_GWF2_28_16]